ncbi:MAG: hypothetical protein LBQ67_04385 [Treponema sp.]|jgi:hypothetical protein|nr:hypothetical protein [Treponema sp.]
MRRFFVPGICLFFLFASFRLSGETIEPFVMPSARFAGMGGRHAAAGDDFYSLFTNPAAFVDVQEQFSVAEISISTYGPVFELVDLFMGNAGSGSDLDISGIVGPKGFAAGLDLGGPLSMGWVGRGLGLGLFNRVKTTAAVRGTMIRPLISGEFLLVGGYSLRIIDNNGHWFDAGFLGKGFFRGALSLEASIFNAATVFDNPMEKPFKTNLGLGLDVGIRYTYRENLTLALVCYDLYSPVLVTPYDSMSAFGNKSGPSAGGASYATVERRLDFGAKYRIRWAFIERYISAIAVMADYRDFLDFFSLIPRNPILNVVLGLEVKILNALSFRFGVSEALPAFGMGLNLSFATLDFAIRGKELGLDPGVQSVYALDLGLLFRY